MITEEGVRSWIKANPIEAERSSGSGTFPTLTPPAIKALKGSDSTKSFLDINRALNRAPSSASLMSIESNKFVRPSDVHYEISRVLYSSLNLTTIIRRVLSFAVTIVNAEKCSFWLVDEKTNELYSTAWDVLPDFEKVEKTFESMQRRASYDASGITITAGKNTFAGDDSETDNESTPNFRIKIGSGIAGYVASTGKGLNIPDAYKDVRFDQSMDKKTGFKTRSILCLPIFGGPTTKANPNGKVLGVATLVNKAEFDDLDENSQDLHPTFTETDVSVFRDFLQTVGIAIHNSILYESVKQKETQALAESKKSSALLEVANSIYGQATAEELFKKIITHALDLTGADRASLYLMNKETQQLQMVFDSANKTGAKLSVTVTEGVAVHVATTGRLLNLEDIDEKVSYVIKSVLAVPILDPEYNIVGVTKLCNKTKPENRTIISFNQTDIQIMQAFSTFCGLALHRTIMYEALEKEREKLAITMEIMSYHATARVDEASFLESLLKDNPVDISVVAQEDFDPHIFSYTDDRLPVIMYNMFEDLGFRQKYKISQDKMAKYILTVRKNYRGNQYHNFTHATCVAHALYLLAKQNVLTEFGFSDVEIYAMFIAAFNHDIDHRGTNNTFQKAANTNLAAFYSSSTMERHHFNHAMTILNSPGHNILETMKSEEYKLCLEIIEKAILATDLALFFKNKKDAQELADTKSYNPKIQKHKDLLLSIALTCSDLSAMSKKWENSQKTADSVYSEFFAQGDEEKKLGLPFSADIMNRENEFQIPKMQVDFYKFIVFPAFQIFHGIIGPKGNHLMDEVNNNSKHWAELAQNSVKYKIKAHL
ncbi:UNVERIFIED_CONTAM: hypothetical protein HDU68_007722 [Siphonaria sp. JEL0065]|nr:hypothetical protein HDU68_007722 [Siphonaria sp. JEL0065]